MPKNLDTTLAKEMSDKPSLKMEQRIKLEQYRNWRAVKYAVVQMANCIEFILDNRTKRGYGIVGMTKKETKDSRELKVVDRNGKELLKYSFNFLSGESPGKVTYSFLLKINNLEISYERDKEAKISEYALGVEGALNETTYMPEGKRTHERLEPIFRLSPITGDDSDIIRKKITEALKEITPRIPSRVPWGDIENILNISGRNPVSRSRFEKIIRSSIR